MEQKNKEFPEEKYSTNFSVEFPEKFNLPSCTIMEVNKPKYSNSKWESMEIEFIDPVKYSISKSLFKLIEIIEECDGPKLFSFTIKIFDRTGSNVVEEWKIDVSGIEMIDFGDLNRKIDINDALIKPKLIIKPLFCELVDNKI